VARPTAAAVHTATKNGDHTAALELAKRLAEFDPNPTTAALLRDTALRAAEQHLDAGRLTDYAAVVTDAQRWDRTDPAWLRAFAVVLSKGGQFLVGDALTAGLNDAALKAKLERHHADWLVRGRDAAAVPEGWKPAYDAVTRAFQLYHSGNDDAAREAVQPIGLTSPFLEWKVLLRGLVAWSGNDDAKALENFTRLSADRIPFRMAAPIRAKIDRGFIPSGGSTDREQSLFGGGVVAKLHKLRPELARRKKLNAAFKAAEGVLPDLKAKLPAAVPRLANCFYHAIVKHGEQDDLTRYRKLFGPPADDPQFHKLEALVYEEIDQPELALHRWAAYEGWLSERVNRWPPPLADRARAVILNRMGGLAEELKERADDPTELDFDGFFGAGRRKPKAKKPPPDPAVYFRKAADLAPDWDAPTRALFERAIAAEKYGEAEAVARRYLECDPRALYFLNALSTVLMKQGRAAEALDLRVRSLANNPLDAKARHFTAAAHIAAARRQAIDGKPQAALDALDAAKDLVQAEMRPSYHALRSTLHRKLGDKAAADEQLDAGLAVPGARLTVRLYMQANAVLAKLKPTDRTAAGKAYTAALAEQPHPLEVNMLLAGWEVFHNEGLTYTGQKTQEKKIYDAMVRAADGDGPEMQFEGLTVILNSRRQFALAKKIAPKLMARFPKNPVFPFCLAEAELGKSSRAYGYKVTEPLRKAKALAEASTEERHKQLLPKIDQLMKAADPFGPLFGGFFGGFNDD
jgi:tetratricopeptide (TPR) repeat protein